MHEEHSGSKQFDIFLSVARSHASFLQIVDSQIKYFILSQIYEILFICKAYYEKSDSYVFVDISFVYHK